MTMGPWTSWAMPACIGSATAFRRHQQRVGDILGEVFGLFGFRQSKNISPRIRKRGDRPALGRHDGA